MDPEVRKKSGAYLAKAKPVKTVQAEEEPTRFYAMEDIACPPSETELELVCAAAEYSRAEAAYEKARVRLAEARENYKKSRGRETGGR